MTEVPRMHVDEVDAEQDGDARWSKIGRVVGPCLAAVAVGIVHPAFGALGGLNVDAAWTLGVLVLMASWWVTLAIDPAITGLIPIVAFGVLSVGTPKEIASPYADEVMFLFGGGTLLGYALYSTGASEYFARALLRIAGSSPFRVFAALMAATALLSGFVSNLATAATMLPLAIATAARAKTVAGSDHSNKLSKNFATSLILGVAFASSIGGALTIIGSPPNPIAVKWLSSHGVEMDFVRWLRFSIPTTVAFWIVAVAILGLWLFPTRGLTLTPFEGEAKRLSRDAKVVLFVFAGAVTAWLSQPMYAAFFPSINDGTIAVLAAATLFLLPKQSARDAILQPSALAFVPWRVLLLFGGGLSLAGAMQRTGLSAALGEAIASAGVLPSIALLAILVTALVLASEVASNTALAAMAVPIVGAMAPGLGVAPETLVIPAVFAASWAFAMPVGTPPNALVFASGKIRARDMMRAGIVLDCAAIVVIVLCASVLL
ncbi:MAG: SLC13/DASS family transporter [Phycisphaerales bacterium]|nr:SLC13/DASS family transporter [Phycisphaerales bacterium]